MTDPFGTAGIRQRVLAGWSAAPVRLREDANAEEDLALGGYRDRLVVELAQNAADAASRAGVPGRLSLTLAERPGETPVLVAANTGAPLDADGVQSLATLRASAKRLTDEGSADSADAAPGSVGRFGVGFAAVLAVSDEPAVLSRTGGVRFSRDDTADLVAAAAVGAPALGAEVQRRDGHVPVLRLPFAAAGEPPVGFDTAVVLPLRDEAAADVVRAQLDAVDDALLLALPALTEVVLDVGGSRRVLTRAGDRWRVHRRAGDWSPAERADLLADRPTEERRQRGWQVLWAVPRDPSQPVPRTLHAPTPTDEPISLPALLLATLPLDPTRRHVAAGPLADRLVSECATAYAELLTELAGGGADVEQDVEQDVLALVPVGLPAGALDGALREQVLRVLVGAPILRGVQDGRALRPRDAVALDVDADPAALEALAPRVAGLVRAPASARAVLRALDVAVTPLADVVETLPAQGDPASWLALYEALSPLAVDANAREALAALPVPLADGRVVRGARGLLLGGPGQLPATALEALAPFGLRVVHPEAAHPLLERLGARPASAREVLDDPAVRTAVEQVADDEAAEPDQVVDAVLALVAAAVGAQGLLTAEQGDLEWLRDLPLPDEDGEPTPAGLLAMPGSVAADLLDGDEIGVLRQDAVSRWPRAALAAVGVLDGLAAVVVQDPDLRDPPEALADLDGFDDWADELLRSGEVVGGDVVGPVAAVRDLDVVRPDRWPELVRHLASEPELRRALLEPVRVRAGERVAAERVSSAPSYTAWWLQRELGLAGTVPPGADDLGGVLGQAPDWCRDVDPQVRVALGVLEPTGGQQPGAAVAGRLLAALSDPERDLDVVACLRLWRLLATFDGVDLPVPQRLRVLDGDRIRMSDASAAVVPDDPRWLQRGDLGGLVVAPFDRAPALADLLDLDLAGERADGAVTSAGSRADVSDVVRALLPTAPRTWVEHDALTVDGHAVDWWVDVDGAAHAATSDGLARALAWAAGAWSARYLLAEVLADPGSLGWRLAEDS
ncbi:sacsin N-terminal ATP-binding-like domain-containing protein [Angustibacter luteus]|uniref:Sacsin N-terminal ATP-binding-like domain-containing protein n=1 Tax=Angustibacter luteus TaxID=658456 RepID=A0ABW1JCE2_9ACTN